jgi:hypothetical protein
VDRTQLATLFEAYQPRRPQRSIEASAGLPPGGLDPWLRDTSLLPRGGAVPDGLARRVAAAIGASLPETDRALSGTWSDAHPGQGADPREGGDEPTSDGEPVRN